MKKILFTALMLSNSIANAQNLSWSTPVALTSTIGFTGPKITISKSTPIITVGDNVLGDLYLTRYVGGLFSSPIKLNPTGFSLSISNNNGPKIAALGDTTYVTYLNDLETDIFFQKSFDGGVTFSDTSRVIDMQGNIPQYPSLAIMAGGNPVISYASLKSTFTDPQYYVTKSFDAGNTFAVPASVTGALGADPCDCCAGNIALHENKVAVIFRNSGNNLRDMRAGISLDTASNFSALGEIDNNNWIIANCPISGGQGVIIGDTLVSCFMNGINGTTTYISALNVNTNQLGYERPIYSPAGVGAQELTTIAGSGDTVGIAWTQQNGSLRNILFSYSTTGASGLGFNIIKVDSLLPNSVYSNPDLAFANGTFHIVFTDNFASNVYYSQATVPAASSVIENSNIDFNISLVNHNSELNIQTSVSKNTAVNFTITDLKGAVVETKTFNKMDSNETIQLNKRLTNGIYFVTLLSKDFKVTKKLIAY